ncbi:MAG: hypothetical protein IID45_08195 [Planctomycetes bacterium]|nr:hypothetical protein [Planctomycetota bacterium]
MAGIIRSTLIVLIGLTLATPALAQNNSAPEVVVTQNGADNLLGDLKFLLELNKGNNREWIDLKEYIEVFLLGVDRAKPIRIDVLLGDGPVRYRLSIPVPNLRIFQKNNLHPLGINTRRRSGSLCQCRGAFVGWMRYKRNQKYATFAEKKSDIPFNMPAPIAAVANLVRDYDLALRGRNTAINAAAQKDRRQWFQKQRKQIEAAVKKKDGETQIDFDLRKLLLAQQLNEGERFYVEAAELLVGWNTDVLKSEGRLDLSLTPIPGTPLEKSIQLLGVKPTFFANIPRSKNAILSARINHPLDAMRQAHFLKVFQSLRDRAVKKIDGEAKRPAAEKKARRDVADLVVQLLAENLKQGLFDSFLEVHPNSNGKNTAIGGMRTVDGTLAVKILQTLQKAGMKQEVKIDIEKMGDLRIHSAKIDVKKHPSFKFFLGDDVLFIATSKNSVWFATGPNALKELKAAVKKTTLPNTGKATDPFVDLYVKVGPWLKLLQEHRGDKGDVKGRKNALAAFKPGIDSLTLKVSRKNNGVVGQMLIQTDVLRFVGNMIAKFAKEQLSTEEAKEEGSEEKKKPETRE